MDEKTLREAIKSARLRKKMTLSDVAQSINSSIGYVHEIETGLKAPSMAMLSKLSEALGLRILVGPAEVMDAVTRRSLNTEEVNKEGA